jgi:hypothetical protein
MLAIASLVKQATSLTTKLAIIHSQHPTKVVNKNQMIVLNKTILSQRA